MYHRIDLVPFAQVLKKNWAFVPASYNGMEKKIPAAAVNCCNEKLGYRLITAFLVFCVENLNAIANSSIYFWQT